MTATESKIQSPKSNIPAGAAPARLSDADALAMYHELSIHQLGKLAFGRLMEMHPEPYRTYVVDRNINYSNVCTARCIFCNFKADPGDADAYTLSFEQIGRKIEELIEIGGTQILMQGGLVPPPESATDGANRPDAAGYKPAPQTGFKPAPQTGHKRAPQTGFKPAPQTGAQPASPTGSKPAPHVGSRPVPQKDTLPFDWYLDLLRFIKKNYPTIHIHAFSPPEIWAFHLVYRMPLRDVLLRLQDAGLATIPGGGGEILVDRVRRKIGQGKALSNEWLEVMRQAHKLGMKTSCTMMMGHIETIPERIEHMRLLRDLQDETGGFAAFIHWPFQPEGTVLGRWKRMPMGKSEVRSQKSEVRGQKSEVDADRVQLAHSKCGAAASPSPTSDFSLPTSDFPRPRPDGEHLLLADAHEYLVMLAIARLYFDNIPNIQSSWVTMGPKIGQIALMYGANDMGSVMMEENVVSQAGATYRLNEDHIRRLITDAGWQPQQRDQYYRPVTTVRKAGPKRRCEDSRGVPLPLAPPA